MLNNIIAGTGHRPNKFGGYHKEIHLKLITIAEKYIKSLIDKPIIISGMALGWDQALAQAAINTNCKLWVYIPFRGQESKWPKESQFYYHELLSKADKIIICSEGGYSAYKMQIRNEKMVDDCNEILAMWNGTTGGTYNCIQYAQNKNKTIINMYSEW